MNTPNRIDDRLHIGLLSVALCLVLAVIVDAQRPAVPAHNPAAVATAAPGQSS